MFWSHCVLVSVIETLHLLACACTHTLTWGSVYTNALPLSLLHAFHPSCSLCFWCCRCLPIAHTSPVLLHQPHQSHQQHQSQLTQLTPATPVTPALSCMPPLLTGCLPTIATIPIFIGLYSSLTNVASQGLLDTQVCIFVWHRGTVRY